MFANSLLLGLSCLALLGCEQPVAASPSASGQAVRRAAWADRVAREAAKPVRVSDGVVFLPAHTGDSLGGQEAEGAPVGGTGAGSVKNAAGNRLAELPF